MQTNNIRYWQVFDSDKTTLISESPEDDNYPVTSAIAELMEVVETMEGIVYIVIRKDEAKRKRKADSGVSTARVDNYTGIFRYQLKLGNEANAGGTGSNMYGGGNMFNTLLQMQEQKFQIQRTADREKAELKEALDKKFKELEDKFSKKTPETDDRMNEKIFQVLDKLLSNNPKQKPTP